MADQIRPEIENVKTIIFRACTAWETQTGRKLGDEASVLDFLRALNTDDQLLNADQATTRPVREALAGLDLSTSASLPGLLSGLGIPGDAQPRFLSTLKNSAQREALIKDAFAAGSPAETARALEAITTREYPLSLYDQFLKGLLNIPGKTVYTFVILIAIVLAILAFIALGPVIRSNFALYKGITPDPDG